MDNDEQVLDDGTLFPPISDGEIDDDLLDPEADVLDSEVDPEDWN